MSNSPLASPSSVGGWKNIPQDLKLYAKVLLSLNLIAFASLIYYYCVYGEMWRADIWSVSSDRFGDFWHYHWLFGFIHTQAFFSNADHFAYPAPCAVILDMLYHSGPYPHGVFCTVLGGALLASAYWLYRILTGYGWRTRDAAAFCAFVAINAYPWWKLLDRSNLEVFVYLFLATGVWAYITGRKSLAAILWGCAGAMKIYPVVMLVLFLRKSALRQLVIGSVTCIVVLLCSFWFVGPTIHAAALGSVQGVTGFLGSYAGTSRVYELSIDHSLLGSIKELCLFDTAHLDHHWKHQSTGYQAAVILIGPILYFMRIRKLPVWNQMGLFLTAIVLLPPVSYDYTLVHTYLTFGVVVSAYLYALQSGRTLPHAAAFFTAFAVIGSTQGWMAHWIYRFNGVIKCTALLTLAVLLLITPLTLGPAADELVEA